MRRGADRVVGSIGPGLLCLVGVCDGDTAKDEEWARNRVVGIRLWTDPETGKRWQKSVKDLGYEVLLVSQFTLHGYAKGNKPDFHYASTCCLRNVGGSGSLCAAVGGDDALAAFDSFVAAVKSKYRPDRVATGAFGEYMQVESVRARKGRVQRRADLSRLTAPLPAPGKRRPGDDGVRLGL